MCRLCQPTDLRARDCWDGPRLADALPEVRAREWAQLRGVESLDVFGYEVKHGVKEDVPGRVYRMPERLHGSERRVARTNDGNH